MNHSSPPTKLVLFYKNLTDVGGAERLIANEFKYFSELGIETFLAANRLEDVALFGVGVPEDRKIVLSAKDRSVPWRLARALHGLGNPPVLCSSGHIDVFLASMLTKVPYALHIHHPNFMSFNDYDKYSVFMSGKFEQFCDSNFGASRFREIRHGLSSRDKLFLNARGALSVAAHRRARAIFVLSEYARREKKALYGVDTLVRMGALDDNFETRFRNCVTKRRGIVSGTRSRILTVARLDRNKRIDQLLRAMAVMRENGFAATLDIAGRGPELEALSALTQSLNLQDRVTFHGFVDDAKLQDLYLCADVFASIDWADYKLTLFEALSHGVQALVSDETEVDSRLLSLGRVEAVKPEPNLVAAKLQSMLAASAEFDADALVDTLADYTWRTYFKKIAQDLSTADLIGTPHGLKSEKRLVSGGSHAVPIS